MVRNMVSEERIKTNLLLTDYLDYWDELTVKAINDEWTLRYYNIIMNLLNSQVDKAVNWLDSEEAEQLFKEEAQYQYELFQALEDEWDSILEAKYDSVEALLQEVYNRGKAKGYADMREHIKFSLTDKMALLFAKEYNFGLIRRLDADTRYQIKNKIISGVLSGENPRNVAPKIYDAVGERLYGSTFSPMQRAVMIARTETSRTQNTGILQSYLNEGYNEVKILTAEDDNVCYTCLSYAYEFNEESPVIYTNRGEEKVHNIIELIKGGMFPPFHPNCRCTYLSIWETKEKPVDDPPFICLIGEGNKQNFKITTRNSALEYYKYKKDPNVKVSFVTDEIKFGLKDLRDDENFFKYEFNDMTIYKSCHGTAISVEEIYKQYSRLPKKLRGSATEIILSSQHINNSKGKALKGYVDPDVPKRINILSYEYKSLSEKEGNETLIHELAHCFDGPNFKYSNSDEYKDVFWEDYHYIENKKIGGKYNYPESSRYISPDSSSFTKEALKGDENSPRIYSEDFADTIMYYFLYPKKLESYRARQKYLNNLFN